MRDERQAPPLSPHTVGPGFRDSFRNDENACRRAAVPFVQGQVAIFPLLHPLKLPLCAWTAAKMQLVHMEAVRFKKVACPENWGGLGSSRILPLSWQTYCLAQPTAFSWPGALIDWHGELLKLIAQASCVSRGYRINKPCISTKNLFSVTIFSAMWQLVVSHSLQRVKHFYMFFT